MNSFKLTSAFYRNTKRQGLAFQLMFCAWPFNLNISSRHNAAYSDACGTASLTSASSSASFCDNISS